MKSIFIAVLLLVPVLAFGDLDKDFKAPNSTKPAMNKYNQAMADAIAAYNQAEQTARQQLLDDLKDVQKKEITANNVDNAVAIGQMTKQYSVKPPEKTVGVSGIQRWVGKYHCEQRGGDWDFTIAEDGSATRPGGPKAQCFPLDQNTLLVCWTNLNGSHTANILAFSPDGKFVAHWGQDDNTYTGEKN